MQNCFKTAWHFSHLKPQYIGNHFHTFLSSKELTLDCCGPLCGLEENLLKIKGCKIERRQWFRIESELFASLLI